VRISTETHGKEQREVTAAALCKERRVMDCNKGHVITKMHCTMSVSAEVNKSNAHSGENDQVLITDGSFQCIQLPGRFYEGAASGYGPLVLISVKLFNQSIPTGFPHPLTEIGLAI
jgi:hypothetical protein